MRIVGGVSMSINLYKILRNSEGATAIEYGLIAALVSVAAIVALTATGDSLNQLFGTTATAVGGAATP